MERVSTRSSTDPAIDLMSEELAAAIAAKGAIHSHGMIGGLGLKALNLDKLRQAGSLLKGERFLVEVVLKRAEQALEEVGIVYGIREEELLVAAEEFVAAILAGEDRVVTRKIAEGELPEPGVDGWIEYPLNYRGRPFHQVANLAPGSQRRNCTVVRGEEVLAILHPAVAPKKGVDVHGESVASKTGLQPTNPSLEGIAAEHTRIEGKNLLAGCDGVCEENAEGKLRVIPEIVVPRVDDATGRVPETGVSQANVVVTGQVKGQGVATAENLFVGVGPAEGTIEGRATIQARNLALHGRVVGESQGRIPPIEVEEVGAVGEVVNRSLSARHLLILRDAHFATLDGEEGIWVDGNLRGGMVKCRRFLQVKGDLGASSGGSNTRIVLPHEGIEEHRKRKMTAAVKHCRDQLQELGPRLEELDKQAEKRAKADPYWARLVKGERCQPQSPLQNKTLQQFAEYVDQKRALSRQIKGVKQTLVRLTAEKKAAEAKTANQEASVVVGGTLHLDVSFEVVREMKEEDGGIPVRFEHEGNQFVRSTLGKARSVLVKQVRAYLDKQSSWVGEKREAIDKMFAGQEKKPTGPEIPDQEFALPIQWLEGEIPAELEVSAWLTVRTREPQNILVKSTARLREPGKGVSIGLRAEGARGVFQIQPHPAPVVSWLEEENIQRDLGSILIGEVSALEVMQGKKWGA